MSDFLSEAMTHFSYLLGEDGVEKIVATPELQGEAIIGSAPSPPGQDWSISLGGMDEHAGLQRIEITEGPGSGVKILYTPHKPPAFVESVTRAEQNLYARRHDLVVERDPRIPRCQAYALD